MNITYNNNNNNKNLVGSLFISLFADMDIDDIFYDILCFFHIITVLNKTLLKV